MKRFCLELPGFESVEVQKVGDVVRLELHSDAMTIILDLDHQDARAVADAIHGACHRDLWQSPEAMNVETATTIHMDLETPETNPDLVAEVDWPYEDERVGWLRRLGLDIPPRATVTAIRVEMNLPPTNPEGS